MEIAHVIIQGVLLGGLYVLFAAGLSLIFGVMRLVNIAHGDLIVVAAYMGYFTMQALGVGPFTSLFVVVPAYRGLRLRAAARTVELRAGRRTAAIAGDIRLVGHHPECTAHPVHPRQPQALCRADRDGELEVHAGSRGRRAAGDPVRGRGGRHRRPAACVLPHDPGSRLFGRPPTTPDIAQLMGIENRHIFALAMALSLAVVAVAGVFIAIRTTFNPFYCPQLPSSASKPSNSDKCQSAASAAVTSRAFSIGLKTVQGHQWRKLHWLSFVACSHGMRRGLTTSTSPIARGMSRIKLSERQRTRILTDDELVRIWRGAAADNSAFGPYIQFLLLTGCRRDEAAELPWGEIEHNLGTAG